MSRKLFFLHKIVKGFPSLYLQEILSSCNVLNESKVFENSYFLYYTKEWFKLSKDICLLESAEKL